MNCHEEITPENDGIEINGGEFYQCEDCHEIEHGYRIYAMNLVFGKNNNGRKYGAKQRMQKFRTTQANKN